MKKKSLGHPTTKTHDRQSPQDWVTALREKYFNSTAPLAQLIFWDKEDKKSGLKFKKDKK